MVEVEDLNLYGVGLFDFRFRFIRFLRQEHDFLARPYGSLEGARNKGVPPF